MAVEPPDISSTVVGQIAQGLFGVHQMLSIGMQAPELALSEAESDALAKCVANVGKYYVRIDGPPNKLAAWGALIMTAGLIYVPRFMMASRRREAQAKVAVRPEEPISPPLQ